jgi:hypothetical protein
MPNKEHRKWVKPLNVKPADDSVLRILRKQAGQNSVRALRMQARRKLPANDRSKQR